VIPVRDKVRNACAAQLSRTTSNHNSCHAIAFRRVAAT
jgi:hypothetical protein